MVVARGASSGPNGGQVDSVRFGTSFLLAVARNVCFLSAAFPVCGICY